MIDAFANHSPENPMSDADDLATMLAVRRKPEADREALDAFIFARFGKPMAVMFTDMVGFSRRVEDFGILHFLQLIQESEALFLPVITQHQGTCLKREGDSLLAVFEEPGNALAAALAMVQITQALNPQRLPEERIEVCIGLGHGEVLLIDGKEVWGAEVNAASKLGEEMAEGGEVLATEAFRQAVPEAPFSEYGVLFGTRPAFRWTGDTPAMPESRY